MDNKMYFDPEKMIVKKNDDAEIVRSEKAFDPDVTARMQAYMDFTIPSEEKHEDAPAKQLYEPFKVIPVNPEVQALQRGVEERLYIVMYYNLEHEEYYYEKFTGRYECYFGLERILMANSVDLDESKVLVETVGTNKQGKPCRFLTHPDDALSIRDFHKLMDAYFGDNTWDISEYDTASLKHDENEFFPSAVARNDGPQEVDVTFTATKFTPSNPAVAAALEAEAERRKQKVAEIAAKYPDKIPQGPYAKAVPTKETFSSRQIQDGYMTALTKDFDVKRAPFIGGGIVTEYGSGIVNPNHTPETYFPGLFGMETGEDI